MATPHFSTPSPFVALTSLPVPSPGALAATGRTPTHLKVGLAAATDLVGDFRSSLRSVQLDCERISAEATAAVDSIERAFDVNSETLPGALVCRLSLARIHPDQLTAEQVAVLLASLDALRVKLVATGIGALPLLSSTAASAPSDLDMPTLVEKRAKETQTAFVAWQKLRDNGLLVNDVLARR